MAWVTRLATDYDNLRTALRWLLDHQAADLSCRLAGALAWWWYPLGRVSMGRDWAEQALGCAGADACSPPLAKALFTAGVLALFAGDDRLARRRLEAAGSVCEQLRDDVGLARARLYLGIILGPDDPVGARALQEQALAVFRQRGDALWMAVALLACGDRALGAGDPASARPLFEESLELFRRLEDAQMAAEALNKLGDAARSSGEHRRAAALYTESLELLRRHGGETGVPGLLHNLGYVAQQHGDHRQALDHFSEAIARFRANGDQRGVAECLVGVAGVALALGQPDRAARLFGAADACLQAAGAAIAPPNLSEYERNLAAARARLGSSAFASARQAGQTMSPEQGVAYAAATAEHLSEAPSRHDRETTDPWLGLLTPREGEIAALLVHGLSNRQIASQLVITEQTVETHVKHLLSKLGLASRYQVQDWMGRHGRPLD